ncbi:agmatine deiminase family protein [Glaciecola sp. MH2013]|uniref:agmatine deiminase family protein n=1 Tax=Glaciecola sp. MH2013 TaxID=2785524 RepID=UPI00189E137C|nr:agmatine deiminase family protein [Glaciecola sp. MH2013]MBF7074078.1 agmatine deiminase family protein [Glaciecola sp. MH2013]
MNKLTLLPEWAEQEAVILAWPHQDTDWQPWLNEVQATYVQLINAINESACVVVLLCRESELGLIKSLVNYRSRVICVPCDYNDTWVRDYAFLTCESSHGNVPVSFTFNGWGQKFDAAKDNRINEGVFTQLCRNKMQFVDVVLEGGAIEIDQNQHLLSTESCLLNPLRNGDKSLESYRNLFAEIFGAQKTTILADGHLDGDDTDGHIDTLVRFTPLHGLVLQSAYNRPEDKHFSGLFKMNMACQQAFPTHAIYELPLPYIANDDGDRLPASYANFLICNASVLFPVYGQPEDAEALEVIQKAFPNHRIIAIDCATLIQQFGSLHCISMQVPTGTLNESVLTKTQNGVAVL